MTADELRAKYNTGYKIIARERAMRERVFPEGHPKRDEKLREMDRLLELFTEMKDFCKEHIAASYEQPSLLDVPRKAEYN